MYRSRYIRVCVLIFSFLAVAVGPLQGQNRTPQAPLTQSGNSPAVIHLRWDARPGIFRYRVQLATDQEFNDVLMDRIVAGTEFEITNLPRGKYFWRIAPLTTKLGKFSSAGAIDTTRESKLPEPVEPRRPVAGPTSIKPAAAETITAGNGWRVAISDVRNLVPAHLRSSSTVDLAGINSNGLAFGLDVQSGVALWTTRSQPRTRETARSGASAIGPLPIKSRTGLDNLVVLSGNQAVALEGASGRELWRVSLPALASSAAPLSDLRATRIFVIDASLQRLLVLEGGNGNLIAQMTLPQRAVGRPMPIDYHGNRGVMIAFENGRIEIRDMSGSVLGAGDAGSAATTAPIFVKGSRGSLVLVGTKNGLTALNSEDLRALGRVAIKDDTPRGILAAADLDGDGNVEVIMLTEHGQVVAVKAADGKILWQAAGGQYAEGVAFADVNGDGVLDVVMAGGQAFALALSGRDGSVLWKDAEQTVSVANHAASLAARTLVVVPYNSGALLVGGDPSRMGLRAVQFTKPSVR